MEELNHYLKIFKKNGYSSDENISDYWFKNVGKLSKLIFRVPGIEESFSVKIRWKSNLGKVCQKEVYNYIVEKQKQKRRLPHFFADIDFKDFTFVFEGKTYSIKQFAESFPTTQFRGITDLRGINLDGIGIDRCNIIKCLFSEASFKNANFQQNRLKATNLVKANFSKSRFVAIIIDKDSRLNQINFSGALINAIEFKDDSIGDSIFPFTKVSYVTLLKDALIKLFQPSFQLSLKNRKETIFISNNTTNLKNKKLIRLTQYIEWYQNIYSVLYNFPNITFIKRIGIFISIFFTKHWSSLLALTINALFINIFFAILIFISKTSFTSKYSLNIIDAFYHSVVTFTTLGTGDIVPINLCGQVIVILNVLAGYIILALFIFLLSNKITYKY